VTTTASPDIFSATISSQLLQKTTRRSISSDRKVEKGLGLEKRSEDSGYKIVQTPEIKLFA